MIFRCLICSSVLFCASFFGLSSCYTSHKSENKSAYIQHVDSMPNHFDKYALAIKGKLHVEGELITDGPLSDIYAGDEVKGRGKIKAMGHLSSSGKVNMPMSRLNALTAEQSQEKAALLKFNALNIDDIFVRDGLFNGYKLTATGEIFFFNHGIVTTTESVNDLPGVWQFDSAFGWTVTGTAVLVDKALWVETDLKLPKDISTSQSLKPFMYSPITII